MVWCAPHCQLCIAFHKEIKPNLITLAGTLSLLIFCHVLTICLDYRKYIDSHKVLKSLQMLM